MLVWYSMMTLMADALQLVDMRLCQMATGKGTADEVFLMVAEKIDAAAEARTIFLRSGDCNQVVDHYRRIVSANFQRLSGCRNFPLFRGPLGAVSECGEDTRGRRLHRKTHISALFCRCGILPATIV